MIIDQKIKKSFVGVYLIDGNVNGVTLATIKKPNLIRRLLTRIFIGWKWVSIIKLKELEKSKK